MQPDQGQRRQLPCPICRYDLTGTIDAGLRRCPECSHRFSEDDLRLLFAPPDLEGRPRSLNPRELRFHGLWLMAVIILALLALVVVLRAIL